MLRVWMYGIDASSALQGVPTNSKVWWYADSAPASWTVDDTILDAVLAVKGGSNAYNTTGGTLAGTWTQPSGSLSSTEIPAHDHGSGGGHTHAIYGQAYSGGSYGLPYTSASYGSEYAGTTSSDSNAHTHSSVGSGSSPTHSHGTTYRPKARIGIICTKGVGTDAPMSSKTWFYANSAPTGWTADGTPSDELIAVKGGSNAYNTTGGTSAGTWTQPDYTLTTSDIPAHDHGSAGGSHSHSVTTYYSSGSYYFPAGVVGTDYTKTIGSGGAHTHTSVGTNTAHNHGTTYRPYGAVGLICSADTALNLASTNKIWFYANAAPTGWTYDSTITDNVLAIKGGSTYTTGATKDQGSWTQPSCTLTTANLPAHDHGSAGSHTHSVTGSGALGANYPFVEVAYNGAVQDTVYTGSAGSHTHSSYGGGGSHNHGTTYRPYACIGVICSKD